jgi:hypothetical protein
MPNPSIYIGAAAMLFCSVAIADKHTSEALEQATEAANAGRDSKSVAEHAAAALQHTEAAKAAQASHPEVVKQITKGEADLNAALKNATQFNTETAARDAADAKTHLQAADTAVQRLEAGKTQPSAANK